jgi:hypothetical protein
LKRGKGPKFSPKLTARAETIALKDRKALELRKAGGSYAEIGRELGYTTRQGAFTSVQRALAAITEEPAKELLTLYRERLDRMYLGLVKAGAYDGDARSVLAACRVLELHAKLSGHLRTDASVNVNAEGASAVVINVSPEWLSPPVPAITVESSPVLEERILDMTNGRSNGSTH